MQTSIVDNQKFVNPHNTIYKNSLLTFTEPVQNQTNQNTQNTQLPLLDPRTYYEICQDDVNCRSRQFQNNRMYNYNKIN